MTRHLAVVGTTGAVGREICALISERKVPAERISLWASQRSAGQRLAVGGCNSPVGQLCEKSFEGVDYAIFSAGSERSRQFAPLAVRAGATVIDNSSAFRMDPGVPLVIPEINPKDAHTHQGIIANPNCSTIIMNMAVWPLHKVNPVKRIVVSTYQAASGAGAAAMEELRTQTADHLAGRKITPKVFPHPIAFNLFSHDSPVGQTGYNTEEQKMIDETRKIFHEPDLAISTTCIRVPIMRAHSASINLTFEHPILPEQVHDLLKQAPGVEVVDDPASGGFPMPLDATGRDECLVGRIRQDAGQPGGRGIELFVCGDQLRKGAALNAIQILELLTQ
ncbi:MAG: aspartate-semialdehyde dehydrogenase [Phycisphaerales bacterium]|nr:MAG: aspartate-semialdehyde dehydrogenase [Phycisphaerales bacterium]